MKWLLVFTFVLSLQSAFADEFAQHLNELGASYLEDFQNMWSESMGQNPASKKYEIFGLLIQTPQGEYKIRNYTRGLSTNTVSTDYSHDIEEALVGQVHTHPQVYETSLSQFDRETPPSAADILGLLDRSGYGSMKKGFTSIVLTKTKIYGLIIEDEVKAIAHFEKMKEDAKRVDKSLRDYSEDLYMRTNVGRDIFEIQKNSAKRITGDAEESGIGLFQTEGSNKQSFIRIN